MIVSKSINLDIKLWNNFDIFLEFETILFFVFVESSLRDHAKLGTLK